ASRSCSPPTAAPSTSFASRRWGLASASTRCSGQPDSRSAAARSVGERAWDSPAAPTSPVPGCRSTGTRCPTPERRSASIAAAAVLAESKHGTLVSAGSYKPPKGIGGSFKGAGVGPTPAYSYQAAVAEVTVDLETGTVSVDKVTTAHDCGRALNPANVEGQVEGSAYMGYGEIIGEEQVFRGGLHKKPSLLDYKIPTSLDTPALEAIVVESVDAEGPFGAKEAGEGPLNPVIPAIANAVFDAIRVRFDETPITAEKILDALGQ